MPWLKESWIVIESRIRRGEHRTYDFCLSVTSLSDFTFHMISVEEARGFVLERFRPLEPERIFVLDALGLVLAEDIISEINVPPHDNSAMDGYAVRGADVEHASPESPVTLRVIGDLAAGYVPNIRVDNGTAIRIMTGAVLPPGADTIVRFEDTSEAISMRATGKGEGKVQVMKGTPAGMSVRRAGEDIHQGDVVLKNGTELRPAEIGVLASIGKSRVAVHRRPRVAILATGDELVGIDEEIAPGKIRNSNEYSNAAAVQRSGGVPILLGIARDNIETLMAKLDEGLNQRADLFITSAGVSIGDYDIVKDVLNSEGEMHFWQVRMKPGKPLAFGSVRGVPLLGLPGNPVSALISFEIFARPAIRKMLGHKRFARPVIRAQVDEDVYNDSERRNFIRVHVVQSNGEYHARTTGDQGSGVLTSMVGANGLLVIPEDVRVVHAGEWGSVEMLDWEEE